MPKLRSVLVGSVESSYAALATLFTLGDLVEVQAVFGLSDEVASGVSGYRRLDQLASAHGAPYRDFAKINDVAVIEQMRSYQPDVIWIVGLSQLVGDELLSIPRVGCVGFHPTRLPLGRGRAPVAWSILKDIPIATSLFLITGGEADSGPILAQVPVSSSPNADARELVDALCLAIPEAVEQACEVLIGDRYAQNAQQETDATYLGIRRDKDGVIPWDDTTEGVHRLVRAAAPPHPGAWTYYGTTQIRILRAETEDRRWLGIPGRILAVDADGSFVVATLDGAIRVRRYRSDAGFAPVVGKQLGVNPHAELFTLRKRVATLEHELDEIKKVISTDRNGTQ